MFINESKLVAQVKKAYRTIGVTIADHDGQLVFDISDVIVAIRYHDVSNKIKGLVMELAGSFPKADSAYYISKDAPQANYEAKDVKKFIPRLESVKYAINKLHISPILHTSHGDTRLLHTNFNKIFGIKEKLRGIISGYDETSGSQPTGPAYATDVAAGIYWTNENGTVIILPSALPVESEYIKTLENIDIQEMIKKGEKKNAPSKPITEEAELEEGNYKPTEGETYSEE